MTTVVEVPGVGMVEFPDGMTQQDIAAAIKRKAAPAPSMGQTVAAGAGESIYGGLANMANLPGKAANAALGTLFPSGEIRTLGGFPGIPVPKFQGFDVPSGRDITSAIESPIQAVMAGQSLGDAFDSRVASRTAGQAENPGSYMVGQGLGDAALLASGRAPFVPRSGSTGLFDSLARNGVEALGRLANPNGATRGARRIMERIATSDAARSVFRGAGRVGEAGLEGYALGVLQDGNPQDLAAVGALNQAVASTGNTLADATFGGAGNRTLRNTATGVLGTFFAIQLLRSGLGDDDVIDTLGDSFTKAALLGAGGYAAGLLGRRGSGTEGTLGLDMPGFADALSTLPRAQVLRFAQSIMDNSEMQRAALNATQLGASDAKKFNDIMRSEDPAAGLRSWMDSNERVNRILTAPDPRLADVPVRED